MYCTHDLYRGLFSSLLKHIREPRADKTNRTSSEHLSIVSLFICLGSVTSNGLYISIIEFLRRSFNVLQNWNMYRDVFSQTLYQ